MGKLSADGTTAQSFTTYAKGWYNAHVKGASVQYTKATGATMIVIDWKPDRSDDYGDCDSASTVREWIMVDGLSAAGEPLRTDKYFDRIDALGVKRDYMCCNNMASKRPFVVKKEDGKYYCPHCGNIAKVEVDVNEDAARTLPWDNLNARILLTVEKLPNSDDERNRVQRAAPMQR